MLWNAKNGLIPLDGADMRYVRFGRGEKPLVLLPGLSDGLTTVKGKALLLAWPYRMFFDKYTVYIFSRKDELPEGCSIGDMAEDQAKAMIKLGIDKACVMGVSQGGMIAQHLAAEHAELVGKLVIAVSAPRVNPVIRESVGTWIELAKQGDHKRLMIDTAEKSYSPEHLKKYRKLYPVVGHIGKPSDYRRFLTNAEAILSFDNLARLKHIACPTLIIGGDEDKVVGIEASYELRDHIPGSELFIYRGLGHAVYEEAKDFNKRVFLFFEKE
ncbi:MAG: alpha/beta hydrolase [Oscillospiraceae bacterium]|nr:alpha/beta hydrolase [Oscillospiraceae bacterium]